MQYASSSLRGGGGGIIKFYTIHVLEKYGCPRGQQNQKMAISLSPIFDPAHIQGACNVSEV